MDAKNMSEIINQYPYVRAEKERSDSSFVDKRLWEHNLMTRQRAAVSFCKKYTGINMNNLSKLTNEDKEAIENCLKENFLSKNPLYFGKRDHIYLDLFD
jgi:hypothetical protein